MIQNCNYTTLEQRIHSQQQILQGTFVYRLIAVVQERILDLFSLEKTRILQKFAANYGLIHSFHKEYKLENLTWKYNIALYKSHKNGNFFLRVEYEFISRGISVRNTLNYVFSDRTQYDNLYQKIHQPDGVEDIMKKERIIMELSNFSQPTTLQEQVDNTNI